MCWHVLFLYLHLSDLIHFVVMQLEGRSDPTTTGTLITIPAERAQLRSTLGTQQLNEEKHKRQEEQQNDTYEVTNLLRFCSDFLYIQYSCILRK